MIEPPPPASSTAFFPMASSMPDRDRDRHALPPTMQALVAESPAQLSRSADPRARYGPARASVDEVLRSVRAERHSACASPAGSSVSEGEGEMSVVRIEHLEPGRSSEEGLMLRQASEIVVGVVAGAGAGAGAEAVVARRGEVPVFRDTEIGPAEEGLMGREEEVEESGDGASVASKRRRSRFESVGRYLRQTRRKLARSMPARRDSTRKRSSPEVPLNWSYESDVEGRLSAAASGMAIGGSGSSGRTIHDPLSPASTRPVTPGYRQTDGGPLQRDDGGPIEPVHTVSSPFLAEDSDALMLPCYDQAVPAAVPLPVALQQPVVGRDTTPPHLRPRLSDHHEPVSNAQYSQMISLRVSQAFTNGAFDSIRIDRTFQRSLGSITDPVAQRKASESLVQEWHARRQQIEQAFEAAEAKRREEMGGGREKLGRFSVSSLLPGRWQERSRTPVADGLVASSGGETAERSAFRMMGRRRQTLA